MPKFRRSAQMSRMNLTHLRKQKLTKSYNLHNIQTLLSRGFTEQELRDLCFYEAEFRPVYDQFPQGASKTVLIRQLLEFAEQRLLLDHLLELARKHNPARYAQHQPYVIISSRPARNARP